MGFDFWGEVAAKEEQRELDEQRNFTHQKFRSDFLRAVYRKPAKFKEDVYHEKIVDGESTLTLPVTYGETAHIVCCPEPLEFIGAFSDHIGDLKACQHIMRALISGEQTYGAARFQTLALTEEPAERMWFNSTKKGVQLRPGVLEGDGHTYESVTLGDLSVHGVVVGRTGAGKSVFLNNLILNMLTEYAPWELDLYLADFKKIELSRYMSAGAQYQTPHLKTCAATSEIRYVITMLTHLVNCMQARQDLFTRLSLQKLSDFRDKYNVVLPRIVLIVDEFQQMFQEATTSETAIINELLMSIIKLGRATGFHLIFASQEMKGALSGKALANFKIKFALPCDSAVSSEILGNAAASTLERGYVLVNTENGKEEYNKQYRVPFVADDDEGDISESYFYKMLAALVKQQDVYGFTKRKTFYQEDEQRDIAELETILEKVQPVKARELAQKPSYYDIITLGHGVVYSEKKYDLETFYIERGRNRNVLAVCPDVDDLAYVQKLLAVNFKHAADAQNVRNFYYDLHPILSAKYDIADDLAKVEKFDTIDTFDGMKMEYYRRLAAIEVCGAPTLTKFFEEYVQKLIAYSGNKRLTQLNDIAHAYLPMDAPIEELLASCEAIEAKTAEMVVVTEPAKYYYYAHYYYPHVKQTKTIPWHAIFKQRNYWISGIEYIENLPKKWFHTVLRNGMSVNMFFLIFCSSDEMSLSELVGRSDYLFASGNVEKIYKRLGMKFTKKSRSSHVIDFKIKSLNTERAFKKYKVPAKQYEVPALNFDEILM